MNRSMSSLLIGEGCPRDSLCKFFSVRLGVHDKVSKLTFCCTSVANPALQLSAEVFKCLFLHLSGCAQEPHYVVLGIAQNGIQASYGFFKYLDTLLQHIKHTLFHCALHPKIECADCTLLTNAIHPPYSLFYTHRILWKVVIDQYVAELKVASFPAGLRAYQDL